MQHLDEGTIHSWLDGALSADEAWRVETHVKECPQCAAAVAEARGFIAAASRILTALDNAPRGIMPAAAPKKRVDPLVWRVAATVLVVAAGTLVVVRNRGSNERPMSVFTDSATLSPQPTSVAERVPVATGPAAVAADEAAPKAPTFVQSRVAGVAAMNAATGPELLKVVGTPRRIGAKVTLYEVVPGDTVTLTESMPLYLDQVVVTGAAVAPMARQATGKTAAPPSKARADAAVTTAPDSQRAAGVASSPPAASAPAPVQREMANALHTLSWTDLATGNTLTLTGRMPEARLQEIKIRIDRERAAAAAKKNP